MTKQPSLFLVLAERHAPKLDAGAERYEMPFVTPENGP